MTVSSFTAGHASLLRAIAAFCERRFAAGDDDEQVVAAIARETGIHRDLLRVLAAICRARFEPAAGEGPRDPARRTRPAA